MVLRGEISDGSAAGDLAFALERKTWSPEVLGALDLSVERLPVPVSPGTVVGVVSASAADATSLRPDTPVVAGGGDGQAAGLGVNALGRDRAYLNLGTVVVGGIYSNDYRIGRAWRTMGSCSGDGYYFEKPPASGLQSAPPSGPGSTGPPSRQRPR